MTGTDPRIATPMDSSTINGRMTDRAIELIGMLNKVIGADGLGTNTFTLSGELGETNQTLSVHTVEPDITDPAWKEKQTVYFGTSHDRLDLIQSKLAENLDNIKTDIADNVTGLFEILNSKSELFTEYEDAVINAQNANQLEKAEADLEAKMIEVLTSDETLNEMINAFFENIELTIARMDEEIFDLLNDYDGVYSDGSTDANSQKFLVTLPNRQGQTGVRASNVLDSIDEVLDLVLQENKEIYETQNGEGSYSQANENTFIQSQVLGNFANGNLTLSDEMIDAIIDDLGLTQEQLDGIDSMGDFLKLINTNKLMSLAGSVYGTTGNDEATLKELFKDHLEITTPKYYEDQRSLFDILNGKAGADDISNENVIFNSIGDQIKRVSNSAIDLFGYGYEEVTGTNLHETIRRSPLSAIEYLEAQKANLSGDESKEVQNLIDNFIDKQGQAIIFMIEQEARKSPINEALVEELENMLQLIDKYNGDTSDITSFLAGASSGLKELFGLSSDDSELPEISTDIELSTFKGVLNEVISLPNVHKALYGNEMREANAINAQFDARKLPDFKQDGSAPEDNAIAPPSIGPSPLAGVLAKIGDVLMQKAYNLEKDANVPTQEWMDENVQMLETINDQLPGLGMSSAGEAFVDSLRENFKDVIKDFFASNIELQNDKNKKETKFKKGEATTDEFQFLVNSGVITHNTKVTDLEDLADQLDNVNYTQEIGWRTNSIGNLNSQIQNLQQSLQNPDLTEDEIAYINQEISRLNGDISRLSSEIISLSRDEEILSAAEEILEVKDDINGNNLVQGYNNMLKKNSDDYKKSIVDFSDSMTDFSRDLDEDGVSDIVQTFKNSFDEANLDLDENGENDFVDINGIINKVGGLSDKIKNIYGGNEAVAGGVEEQSIRRLILLMFVFSMLEAGEWDYRRYEADTTRYQVT